MKSRRQKVLSTIQSPSWKDSEPIPVDLIIQILTVLPLKSIARCRCVSKLWASMLRLPYFNDLFISKSRAGPQLLFARFKYNELFFFSSPQPQNLDAPLAVNHHMKFVVDQNSRIFTPINGLVCIEETRTLNGRKNPVNVTMMCNPSTGQSFDLPKMKTRRWSSQIRFMGYDPIEKQFKALGMTYSDGVYQEHQVLTLGGATGKQSWRMIECGIPHYPRRNVICINGLLYYVASLRSSVVTYFIVCFDIRSEKFSFVEVRETFISVTKTQATFINYKGRLGSLTPWPAEEYRCITGESTGFEMCILEDPKKHEWSKRIYEFPTMWQYVVGDVFLILVGVTATNDVVFSPFCPSNPFYIVYYSLESKTFTRVYIQGMGTVTTKKKKGMGTVESAGVYTFLDHVENVMTL